MAEFSLKIMYFPGLRNALTDALSRLPGAVG